MLMVISPAKTLDYAGADYPHFTQPAALDQSQQLASELRNYDTEQLSKLMKISDKLAALNHQRYLDFQTPFTPDNAKQALLVFKGDVYKGIHVEDYDEDDLAFAQAHLRILSGLYGLLRPLDLMQPYRLEMGTRLKTPKGKNLYEFWGDQISDLIDADLQKSGQKSGEKNGLCLVNLASNEYFKAVNPNAIKARILNIDFKENKAGTYKIVAIYAKKARGLMVDFVIRNRIDNPELVKGFDSDGYAFNEKLSTIDHWVFTRD